MNINLVSSLLTLNKYLSVGLFLGKGMFKDHTKDANERFSDFIIGFLLLTLSKVNNKDTRLTSHSLDVLLVFLLLTLNRCMLRVGLILTTAENHPFH